MSRAPPPPAFILHGIAATSSDVINLDGRSLICVGTSEGECALYDMDTYKRVEQVYDDIEHRSISSVGLWKNQIWLQVRAHAMLFLEKIDGKWVEKIKFETEHYGYCGSTVFGECIAYPDLEGKARNNVVRIRNIVSSKVVGTFPIPENAVPMCLNSSSSETTSSIFIADEKGSLMKLNKNGEVTDQISLCTTPLFCTAVNGSRIACGGSRPPIRILDLNEIKKEGLEIHYPSESGNCTCLALSPSGHSLVAGFSDGTLRGFSTKSGRCLFLFTFHTQTISSIQYIVKGEEHKMIATSADGKITFWKLK